MTDELHLSSYDNTPVFTIKTVVQETGIPPATLRAWERRYGVLSAGRSEGGYRLYSERDIAILRWLKRQVDAGVAISRAVALLEIRHLAAKMTWRWRHPRPDCRPACAARPRSLMSCWPR